MLKLHLKVCRKMLKRYYNCFSRRFSSYWTYHFLLASSLLSSSSLSFFSSFFSLSFFFFLGGRAAGAPPPESAPAGYFSKLGDTYCISWHAGFFSELGYTYSISWHAGYFSELGEHSWYCQLWWSKHRPLWTSAGLQQRRTKSLSKGLQPGAVISPIAIGLT